MQLTSQTTESILLSFRSVTLDEFDRAALMNRVETKYLIPKAKVQRLLDGLKQTYYCLETAGDKRSFGYTTWYYDTTDLRLYLDHHNGYLKRLKVRTRRYDDSDRTFFEIKQKCNALTAQKTRVETNGMSYELSKEDYKLISHPHVAGKILEWKLGNHFNRISLCNDMFTERVSIDRDIRIWDSNREMRLKGMAVVEVKQYKCHNGSQAIRALRDIGAIQASFSKYAVGTALLHPEIKQNNFKPVLALLKKYNYA